MKLKIPPSALVSSILYGIACFMPALKVDEGGHACTALRMGTLPGILCLLLGWFPPYTFVWSANILFFASWICLLRQRYKAAVILAWLAFIPSLLPLDN